MKTGHPRASISVLHDKMTKAEIKGRAEEKEVC